MREKAKRQVYQIVMELTTLPSSYELDLKKLEQAHLVSQRYAWLHLYVHWHMFRLALYNQDWVEFVGQIPRLLLAVPGSWTGKAPRGNVGTTRMGIFEESSKFED
jgi:hypothetical protein